MLFSVGAIVQSFAVVVLFAIFFLFAYFIYRLVMLGRGQTLGKKVLGLRVVNAQTGSIPGFWRMVVREIFGRFVSGLFFGVGYVWAIFDKNGQAWHDKLAGTVVVRNPGAASREIIRGFMIVATLIGISTACIITAALRSQSNRAALARSSIAPSNVSAATSLGVVPNQNLYVSPLRAPFQAATPSPAQSNAEQPAPFPAPAVASKPYIWPPSSDFYTAPATKIVASDCQILGTSHAGYAFSNDSSHFAYISYHIWGTPSQLIVCPTDDPTAVQVTTLASAQGGQVVWSPDDSRILIYDPNNSVVVDLHKGSATSVQFQGPAGSGDLYWENENSVWCIDIQDKSVKSVKLDLDTLTSQEVIHCGSWSASPREIEQAKKSAFALLPTSEARKPNFHVETGQLNGRNVLLLSSNDGLYSKVIDTSCTGFTVAPDSSVIAVAPNTADNSIGLIHLQVAKNDPLITYKVSFSTGRCTRDAIESLENWLASGKRNSLQVHDARVNPLNGKLLGITDNTYTGDVRVLSIDDQSMEVATEWDDGIVAGKVVAGLWVMDNGTWNQRIPADQVWGILQPAPGASTIAQPVQNIPLAPYSIVDLGALPGSSASSATAINSLGQIVGTCQSGVSSWGYAQEFGFFYDGMAMRNLGNIGGDLTCPQSVNNHGLVCGFASVGPGAGNHAFTYDGSIHDLGYFDGIRASAVSVNDAGDLLIQARSVSIKSGDAIRTLPGLGGTKLDVHCINSAGNVVGAASLPDTYDVMHAFYFDGTVSHDLGTLGGRNSVATAVNDYGLVVGASDAPPNGKLHAFSCSNDLVDLGTLGGESSQANTVNNRGQIVGWAQTNSGDKHGFISDGKKMKDLNDLIPPYAGWTIASAQGINNSGQIAANGTDSSGVSHALLLKPNPGRESLIPQPPPTSQPISNLRFATNPVHSNDLSDGNSNSPPSSGMRPSESPSPNSASPEIGSSGFSPLDQRVNAGNEPNAPGPGQSPHRKSFADRLAEPGTAPATPDHPFTNNHISVQLPADLRSVGCRAPLECWLLGPQSTPNDIADVEIHVTYSKPPLFSHPDLYQVFQSTVSSLRNQDPNAVLSAPIRASMAGSDAYAFTVDTLYAGKQYHQAVVVGLAKGKIIGAVMTASTAELFDRYWDDFKRICDSYKLR